MDDFDDVEELEALEAVVNRRGGEVRNGDDVKRDCFAMLDSEFLKNFRFSKGEVERLSDILRDNPAFDNVDFSVDYQVLTTLGILGGNYFQRVGALVGRMSQSSQCIMMIRVVRAVNSLKDDYIHFPSEEILRTNSAENFRKYSLPDFGWAVDGVHMIFEEKPREIPPGVQPRSFFNRKLR